MKTPVFPLCLVCFVYEFLEEKFVLSECVGLMDERYSVDVRCKDERGCILNCVISHTFTHTLCV